MIHPLNPATVTAVLGSTNTGKTHYAVERMLGRVSGVIGLPLRLLAREVYDKICAIKGAQHCALITGEEKIQPKFARYFVCTVEAMPIDRKFAFVAIDEIQLCGHPERGHIFTDRLLHMRGTEETLLLGAETIRPLIRELLPDVRHETRERFSALTYSGHTKLTRLPKRSVIVAFSSGEVYAIAELIRRYRGGAAIVMGALSPRTRNAQAELYQSGEVDFLVATDAVGMGLNLDADHVAFASMRKFDGRRRRLLTPMEAGQIAGRAGRFRNNGTFGTTGDCLPMDDELVAKIENHSFEPQRWAEWRNEKLRFETAEILLDSLAKNSPHKRLRRVAPATDEDAFEGLLNIADIKTGLRSPQDVKELWDICQIPDFRNLTIDTHVRLLSDIYDQIQTHRGKISDEYLRGRIARLDHTEGGVDVLSVRLAQIRTWTYCVNKTNWVNDTNYWINQARAVEDRLSDALHQKLAARFVDRRTNALLRGIGKNIYMDSTIKDNGEVWIDGHKIGHLDGLAFKIDTSGSDLEAKALQAAADKAVGPEVNRRLTSICAGQHAIFTLSNDGFVLWGGQKIGKIAKSGSIFNPDVSIVGGEMGDPNLCALTEERMRSYLRGESASKLECLLRLKTLHTSTHEDIRPDTKGFAYQLLEHDGHLDRREHGKLVYDLEQDSRKQLREAGVIFGQYDVYLKDMMKPKPATLLSLLAAYGAGGDGKPFIPFAGVTSLSNEGEFSRADFSREAIARAGYRVCGPRIIRFDILNRLADLIRQAQHEGKSKKFQIMQEMLALLGCTYTDIRGVLETLGYKAETAEPAPVAEAPAAEPSPETGKPTSVAVPKEGEDAKTSDESVASAEVPKETVIAPSSPAKTLKKRAAPKPLSIYHHRETDAEGKNIQHVNSEYWVYPARPKNKRPPQGSRAAAKGRKARPPKDRPQIPNPKQAAKEQRRIEDSPFAALLALKGGSDGKT